MTNNAKATLELVSFEKHPVESLRNFDFSAAGYHILTPFTKVAIANGSQPRLHAYMTKGVRNGLEIAARIITKSLDYRNAALYGQPAPRGLERTVAGFLEDCKAHNKFVLLGGLTPKHYKHALNVADDPYNDYQLLKKEVQSMHKEMRRRSPYGLVTGLGTEEHLEHFKRLYEQAPEY